MSFVLNIHRTVWSENMFDSTATSHAIGLETLRERLANGTIDELWNVLTESWCTAPTTIVLKVTLQQRSYERLASRTSSSSRAVSRNGNPRAIL